MRIALNVEYQGTQYSGWQRQVEVNSVQAELEQALSKVADSDISVFCAGRTDAGVHATGQVVHFDTDVERSDRAWVFGTNQNLPDDISVTWSQIVSDDFHARFSATARSYCYVIYNHPIRCALRREYLTWHYDLLDVEKMQQGTQFLFGEHDFSSFRAAQCQSKTAIRNIEFITITQRKPYIILEIKANAFLHNMVRNIVGVLMKVGSGQESPGWVQEVLDARDRRAAATTAPASGLCLYHVDYPDHFNLPKPPKSDLVLF